ncbi:MAG: HTH domain-containing protein [Chloroflexi bacterium]|nr:HTH domain-containing protein [Chloroflexota bacterium]
MYLETLRKTGDDLVRMAGGYNLTTLAAVGMSALVVGVVIGSFFGFFISISLLVACLLAFGAVAFVISRRAEGSSISSEGAPATQHLNTEGAPSQTVPAFQPPAPTLVPAPVAAPVAFSDLERRLMERLAQSDGDISVSALAAELDVSGDSVRQTIGELAARGVISLS